MATFGMISSLNTICKHGNQRQEIEGRTLGLPNVFSIIINTAVAKKKKLYSEAKLAMNNMRDALLFSIEHMGQVRVIYI